MMKKVMSILLSLALVLGLFPTIAMADTEYPEVVTIRNSAGTNIELHDKEYLASNDATSATANWTDAVTNYVARYDAANGRLYLNGYAGKVENTSTNGDTTGISADKEKHLEIILSGTNSIKVSGSTTNNKTYGIVGGNLTIAGDGSLTVESTAKNDSACGIYTGKGMTISAKVSVSASSETTECLAYGLYADNSVVITLGVGSDMKVTAKTNNTSSALAYGIYTNQRTVVYGKLAVDLDSPGWGIYRAYKGKTFRRMLIIKFRPQNSRRIQHKKLIIYIYPLIALCYAWLISCFCRCFSEH